MLINFNKEKFSKIIYNQDKSVTKGYSLEHKIANFAMLLFATFGFCIWIYLALDFNSFGKLFSIVPILMYGMAITYLSPVVIHKDITITKEDNFKEVYKQLEEI